MKLNNILDGLKIKDKDLFMPCCTVDYILKSNFVCTVYTTKGAFSPSEANHARPANVCENAGPGGKVMVPEFWCETQLRCAHG